MARNYSKPQDPQELTVLDHAKRILEKLERDVPSLLDAVERVLGLSGGQHSLGEQVAAHEDLAAAFATAHAEAEAK